MLTGALDLVVPGGNVFVGDVRNLRLHRALRTSVELLAADATVRDATEVRRTVDLAVARETELLVDPDYFAGLPATADLAVKSGTDRNELTGHRYDVVLSTAPRPEPAAVRELVWGRDVAGTEALARDAGGPAGRPAGHRCAQPPDRRRARRRAGAPKPATCRPRRPP
ncbi:hypothetical protein GCM10017687_31170 [Streptomyces echinatus]